MAGHSRSKNGVASLAYVPAIHVCVLADALDVDARDKHGHDGSEPGGLHRHSSSTGPPCQRFTALVSMPNMSSRRPQVWLMMSSTVFGRV